jgi:trigger factor
VQQSLKAAGKTPADEGKSEEELRAEYRTIAERRVRLGLVIGEIGEKSNIQVNQDELRRALIEQARRYPGQERHVYEYYEKNPAALVELRAPLFEDKVVDYVADQAKPAEKKVSVEDLLKTAEGEDDLPGGGHHRHHGHDEDDLPGGGHHRHHGHDHDHDHHHHDHDHHHHDHDHHHHDHDHHHHDHDHDHHHGHDHDHHGHSHDKK